MEDYRTPKIMLFGELRKRKSGGQLLTYWKCLWEDLVPANASPSENIAAFKRAPYKGTLMDSINSMSRDCHQMATKGHDIGQGGQMTVIHIRTNRKK